MQNKVVVVVVVVVVAVVVMIDYKYQSYRVLTTLIFLTNLIQQKRLHEVVLDLENNGFKLLYAFAQFESLVCPLGHGIKTLSILGNRIQTKHS